MSANPFFMSGPEQEIKETFYTSIFDEVFPQDDLTPDNLTEKLQEAIGHAIVTILAASSSCPGIRLPSGRIITNDNCPAQYRGFFEALLTIKSKPDLDAGQLRTMMRQILTMESFQSLNPGQFILGARGLAIPAPHYDEGGVTLDLIRRTFYNEMVVQTLQAIGQNWLTTDDLENQESSVYFVLPALTIAAAVEQSQKYQGLLLLNGKMLTQKNCPDDARMLVEPVLALKGKLGDLTEEDFFQIRQRLSLNNEPGADASEDLLLSFKEIKGTAVAVSQKRSFHEMVPLVIKTCLESLKPVSAPSMT